MTLVDKEKGKHIFGAHYGLSQKTIAAIEAELHIPLEEGLVGAVVTTSQPVVVADVSTDLRWIPMKTKELMRSFLGVSLVGRYRQPLGALTLSHPEVMGGTETVLVGDYEEPVDLHAVLRSTRGA